VTRLNILNVIRIPQACWHAALLPRRHCSLTLNEYTPVPHFSTLLILASLLNRSKDMLALPWLLAALFAPRVAGKLPVQYRSKVGRGLIDVGPGNGLTRGRPGDNIAFLTTRDGNVFTIRATTGKVLNRYVPTVVGECTSVVDWNDGSAVYGAYAIGNTIVLITADGNLFTEFTIDQGLVNSQPVVKNNLIYIASNTDSAGIVSVYDPFNTNPAPRVFAQQTLTNAQIGPLSKGPKGIYFGGNNGIVFFIDTSVNKYDPQVSIFGQSSVAEEDMRGRVYADTADVVVHTPGGNIYGWNPADGQLKFALSLETSDAGTYGKGITDCCVPFFYS
jgi:hypothetical protein